MAKKKKTNGISTHSIVESDVSTPEQLTIFNTTSEILDRQYDITDTVLHGVKKFRKSSNGNLDEVRDFLEDAYNLDIKDLDQDVKKFIEKEMKSGILKPSTPKDAKSRNRSRSKRRNRSNSRQT